MGAAAVVGLGDWAEPKPSDVPGVGVIAESHSPLPRAQLADNDPSIDYFPDLSDMNHPALQGVFRLNLLQVGDNDGKSRVGLILPSKSTFTAGGPGPGSFGVQATEMSIGKDPAGHGLFPTCDKTLIAQGHQDARKILELVSGDLSWKVDCNDWGTVIWMTLPKRVTNSVELDPAAQQLSTTTAGHVIFVIPDYTGIVRTGFDTWEVSTSLETGRAIPNVSTENVAQLFGASAHPSVSFHEVGVQSVTNAYPADYNFVERPFLHDSAPTWKTAMDGDVYNYTVEMRRSDLGWWKGILDFTGPLVLGAIAGALGPWAYQRLRNPGVESEGALDTQIEV